MRLEIGLPLATEPDDVEFVSASKYGAALPELLRTIEARTQRSATARATCCRSIGRRHTSRSRRGRFFRHQDAGSVFLPRIADALFKKLTHRWSSPRVGEPLLREPL